jgi:hypothetical protein
MNELIIFVQKEALFKNLDYSRINLLLTEEDSEKTNYFLSILDILIRFSTVSLKSEHHQFLIKIFSINFFNDVFKNFTKTFKIRFLFVSLFSNLFLISYENIIDLEKRIKNREEGSRLKTIKFSNSHSSYLINQNEVFAENYWVNLISKSKLILKLYFS